MNPTESRPSRRFVVRGLAAASASLLINNGCLGMADRALRPRDPTPQTAAPIAPTPFPSPRPEANPSPATDIDAVIKKAGTEAGLRINQKEIDLWDKVNATTSQPIESVDDLVHKRLGPTLQAFAESDIFGPVMRYFTGLGGKVGVVPNLPDNHATRINIGPVNSRELSIDFSISAIARLHPEQIALELSHQIAVVRELGRASNTIPEPEIFANAGAATAEIYIAFQAALGRPPKGINRSLKERTVAYIACGKDGDSDCWQRNYRQLPIGPAAKA